MPNSLECIMQEVERKMGHLVRVGMIARGNLASPLLHRSEPTKNTTYINTFIYIKTLQQNAASTRRFATFFISVKPYRHEYHHSFYAPYCRRGRIVVPHACIGVMLRQKRPGQRGQRIYPRPQTSGKREAAGLKTSTARGLRTT